MELHINGQLADTLPSESVTQIVESAVFDFESLLISPRSATCRLPATARNLGLFGCAHLSDLGAVPATEYGFDLFHNGLPLISGGSCRLLRISVPWIEVALSWGVFPGMKQIMETHLPQLASLSEGAPPDISLAWNSESQFLSGNDTESSFGFAAADFGMGTGDMRHVHPSVRVTGILELISQFAGLDIDYSAVENVLQSLWIPLTTRNSSPYTFQNTFVEFVPALSLNDGSASARISLLSGADTLLAQSLASGGAFSLPEGNYRLQAEATAGDAATGTGQYICASLIDNLLNPLQPAYYNLCLSLASGSVLKFAFNPQPVAVDDSIYWNIAAGVKESEFAVGNAGEYFLQIYLEENYPTGEWAANYPLSFSDGQTGGHSLAFSGKLYYDAPQAWFGGIFPVVENLPDMSCSQFIRQLCSMLALYARYDEESQSLLLLPVAAITSSEADAPSWENTVSSAYGCATVEYALEGFGRHNYFRYARDGDTLTDTGGTLFLEGYAASAVELAELLFAPCENRNGVATVPCYASRQNISGPDENGAPVIETTVDFNASLLPRILKQNDTAEGQPLALTFPAALRFGGSGGLLALHYGTFAQLASNPLLMEVDISLPATENVGNCVNRLVRWQGNLFLPLHIEIDANGQGTATLLRYA